MRGSDGQIVRWIGTCTDINAAKRQTEQIEVLSRELSHRIKNIFAVIGSLISMSARQAPEHKAFAAGIRQRIGALGRAHEFVRPHSEESRKPGIDTTFQALVAEILSPYPAHDEGRIEIEGDDETVDDRSATPLALLIHELATNATKYGSLSNEGGRVTIATHVDGEEFVLEWIETGGPKIASEPDRTGFGTDLTEISIRDQLGGGTHAGMGSRRVARDRARAAQELAKAGGLSRIVVGTAAPWPADPGAPPGHTPPPSRPCLRRSAW